MTPDQAVAEKIAQMKAAQAAAPAPLQPAAVPLQAPPKAAPRPMAAKPVATPIPEPVVYQTGKDTGYVLPPGTSFGDATKALNAPEAPEAPVVFDPITPPTPLEAKTAPWWVDPETGETRSAPPSKVRTAIEDIPGASEHDLAAAEASARDMQEKAARGGIPATYAEQAAEKVRHIKALREKGTDITETDYGKGARDITNAVGSGLAGVLLGTPESTVALMGYGAALPDMQGAQHDDKQRVEEESRKLVEQTRIKEAGPGAVRARQHDAVQQQNFGKHVIAAVKETTPDAAKRPDTLAAVEQIRQDVLAADDPATGNDKFSAALTDYYFKQDNVERELSTDIRKDAQGNVVLSSDKIPATEYHDKMLAARAKALRVLLSLRAEGEMYWPYPVLQQDLEKKDPGFTDYVKAWVKPATEETESGLSVRTQGVLPHAIGMMFVGNTLAAEGIKGLMGGDTNLLRSLSEQSMLTDKLVLDWRHVPEMVDLHDNHPSMFGAAVVGSLATDFFGPDLLAILGVGAKVVGFGLKGTVSASKWVAGQERVQRAFEHAFKIDGDVKAAVEVAKTAQGREALALADEWEQQGHKLAADSLRARVARFMDLTPEGRAVRKVAGGHVVEPGAAAEHLPAAHEQVAALEAKLADLADQKKKLSDARQELLDAYDERLARGDIPVETGARLDIGTEQAKGMRALDKEMAPLRTELSAQKQGIEAIESGRHEELYGQASEEATRVLREQAHLDAGGVAAEPVEKVFPKAAAEPLPPLVPEDVVRNAFGELFGAAQGERLVNAENLKKLLSASRVEGKNSRATEKLAGEMLSHIAARDPHLAKIINDMMKQGVEDIDILHTLANMKPAALEGAVQRTLTTAAVAQMRVDDVYAALLHAQTEGGKLSQAEADLAAAEAAVEAGKAQKVGTIEAQRLDAAVEKAREKVRPALDRLSTLEGERLVKAESLPAALEAEAKAKAELERAKQLAEAIPKPKKVKATAPPPPANPVEAGVQGIQTDAAATGAQQTLGVALSPKTPLQAQQRAQRFDVWRLFFGASGEPFSRRLAAYRPDMVYAARQRGHLLFLHLERDWAGATNNALWKYTGGPEAADFAKLFGLPTMLEPAAGGSFWTYRVSVDGGKPVAYNARWLRAEAKAGTIHTVEPVSIAWTDQARLTLFPLLDKLRVAGRDTAATTNNWLRSLLPFSDPAAKEGEEGLVRLRDMVLVDDAEVAKGLGLYQAPPDYQRNGPAIQTMFTAEVVGFRDGKVVVQPYQYQAGTRLLDRTKTFPEQLLDPAALEYMERGRTPREEAHTRPLTHAEWAGLRAEEDAIPGSRTLSYREEVRARMEKLNPPDVPTTTSFSFNSRNIADQAAREAVEQEERAAAFLGVPVPRLAEEGVPTGKVAVAVEVAKAEQPAVATAQAVVARLPGEWQAVEDAKKELSAAQAAVRALGDKPIPEALTKRLADADAGVAKAQAAYAATKAEHRGALAPLENALKDAQAQVVEARAKQRIAADAAKKAASPAMQKRIFDSERALADAQDAHRDVKGLRAAADTMPTSLEAALRAVQEKHRSLVEEMRAAEDAQAGSEAEVRAKQAAFGEVPHVTPARARFEQSFRQTAMQLGHDPQETSAALVMYENWANNLHAQRPSEFPTPDAYYARFVVRPGTDAERAAHTKTLRSKVLAHFGGGFKGKATDPILTDLLTDNDAWVDALREFDPYNKGQKAETDSGRILADALHEAGVVADFYPPKQPKRVVVNLTESLADQRRDVDWMEHAAEPRGGNPKGWDSNTYVLNSEGVMDVDENVPEKDHPDVKSLPRRSLNVMQQLVDRGVLPEYPESASRWFDGTTLGGERQHWLDRAPEGTTPPGDAAWLLADQNTFGTAQHGRRGVTYGHYGNANPSTSARRLGNVLSDAEVALGSGKKMSDLREELEVAVRAEQDSAAYKAWRDTGHVEKQTPEHQAWLAANQRAWKSGDAADYAETVRLFQATRSTPEGQAAQQAAFAWLRSPEHLQNIASHSAYTARVAELLGPEWHAGNPDNPEALVKLAEKGLLPEYPKGPRPPDSLLAHAAGSDLKGIADFTNVRQAVLSFFKTADAETLIAHEPAHLLRALLPSAELRDIEDAMGVVNGEWTREAEERFAHQYTSFLRNGHATGTNPALDHAYAEVTHALEAAGVPKGDVDPVLTKAFARLNSDAPFSTTATAGGYGNRFDLMREMQAHKTNTDRLARAANAGWLHTVAQNMKDFMRPSRDVMEQSLAPAVKQLLRMATGEWDTLNRDIATAIERKERASKQLDQHGWTGEILQIIDNGTKPSNWQQVLYSFLDKDRVGALVPADEALLAAALQTPLGPDGQKIVDSAKQMSDRLFAASQQVLVNVEKRGGHIVREPVQSWTDRAIRGKATGALRPQALGDAMFAQAAGLAGIHNRLLRDGLGIGMTVSKEDAKAAEMWTAGWHAEGNDRGMQVMLNGVDGTEYRAPLKHLFSENTPAEAHKTPFVSAGEHAVRMSKAMNEEVYVPRAVLDRMESQIGEVAATQNMTATRSILLQSWKQNLTMGLLTINPAHYWVDTVADLMQVAAHVGIAEAVDLGALTLVHNILFGTAGVGAALGGIDKLRGAEAGTTMAWADMQLAKVNPRDMVAKLRAAGNKERLDRAVARGAFGQDTTAIMDAGRYRSDGKFEDVIITMKDGRKYSAKALYKIFAAEGVFETQGFGELVKNITEQAAERGWLGRMFTARAETVQRTANFIAIRQRAGLTRILMEGGLDPETAARTTVEALYDYKHSLHPVERNELWQWLNPFWTYDKNNSVRAMRDAFNPMGFSRIARVNKIAKTAAKGATYLMDFRDAAGFDTDAMQQDDDGSYEKYQAAMAKAHALGLTDTQVFDILRNHGSVPVPELDDLYQYWTDDPKQGMLPSYLMDQIVAYSQISRNSANRSFFTAEDAKGQKGKFDQYRAIVAPTDPNLSGLNRAVVLTMMLVDLGVNRDAGTLKRFEQEWPKLVGDMSRNPIIIAILAGMTGHDLGTYDYGLPPELGEALHRFGHGLLSMTKPGVVQGETATASQEMDSTYAMPGVTKAVLDTVGGVGPLQGGLSSMLTSGVALEKTARALTGNPGPGTPPDAGKWDIFTALEGQKSKPYSLFKQQYYQDLDADKRAQDVAGTPADRDILPRSERQTGAWLRRLPLDQIRGDHDKVRQLARQSGGFTDDMLAKYTDNQLLGFMISNGWWTGPLDTPSPAP